MKKIIFALGVMLVATVQLGCKKEPSLTGTWNTTLAEVPVPVTVTINSDQSLKLHAAFNQPPLSLTMDGMGKYTLEGKELTIVLDKLDIGGLPDSMKSVIKPQLDKNLGKQQHGTMEWKNDNQFTLADGNGQVVNTFNRVVATQ